MLLILFPVEKYKTNIDDVGKKRRYFWNILHWSENDFKSMIYTNRDYSETQKEPARNQTQRAKIVILKVLLLSRTLRAQNFGRYLQLCTSPSQSYDLHIRGTYRFYQFTDLDIF